MVYLGALIFGLILIPIAMHLDNKIKAKREERKRQSHEKGFKAHC